MATLIWAAPAVAQPAETAAADALVRSAEEELHAALAERDRDEIAALLAPDFTAVDGAVLAGAEWLDRQLTPCGGGPTSITRLNVVVTGNTALASYEAAVQFENGCATTLGYERRSDVWVRREGRWLLLMRSMASTTVVPPPSQPPEPTPAPPAPRAWVGSGEVTVLSTRGNVNTFTFGSVGDIAWQHGRSRTTARAAFLRTTSLGQERGRSIDLQLRQSRTLSAVAELFGRAQYQRDLFAGILQRYGADAGVGLRVVHDAQRLQATFGAGSTHEVRLNVPSQSGPVATAGVQYRLTIAPATNISVDALSTTYLNRAFNWRVETTPSLTTVLRRPFSLRVSYTTKYNSRPVPGFKGFDAVLSLGLVGRF